MIKYLRRNQQVFILFIFIYAIASVISIFIGQPFDLFQDRSLSTPFLSAIIKKLIINKKVFFLISQLTIILILFIGFYLVRIIIKYLIISNRSQFSALFYISIASFGFKFEMFSGAILGSVFLLFAIDRVFGTINNKNLSFRYLDAGALLSIGSLFYFNIIFLLPFLLFTQLILRAYHRKELIYILLGLILPFLYIFSIYYIVGKSVPDVLKIVGGWMQEDNKVIQDWRFAAGLGFYLFVIVIASFFAFRRYTSTKIQVRKLYLLSFLLFLNVLAIYFFIPSTGNEIFFLLAIPVSILMSIYFAECRSNIFNSIILLLLIGIPIALNLLN